MRKRKLKILQVVPYFYPSWGYGGPGPIVYWISQNLLKFGHKVTVFTTDAGDEKKRLDISQNKPIDNMGIETYYFRNVSNQLAYHNRIYFSPSLIDVAKREIKKFDIIHIHDFFVLNNYIIWYFAKKYKIPYLISPHGGFNSFAQSQKWFLKKVFIDLWGRRILKGAKKIIALNSTEKEVLLCNGIELDKIIVLPNGITISDFYNLLPREEIRKKYQILENTKVIVFLGRIDKIKGLDLLIKAFSLLSKEDQKLKLLIIGRNSGYLLTLKKIIKEARIAEDKIIFTGLLSGKEKISLFSAGDIFVSPSYSEGFSISILEAMACGLPIIISDKCNFPEVAQRNAGLIISPNTNELISALRKLIRNKKLRRVFGENAKKLIKEKYQWTTIVKKLEELYFDVINQ